MYESEDPMVSHPSHYKAENGLEVIDVIEAFTEGLEGIEATDTANIIKYACRWKQKGGVQDLEKIIWYAKHLVEHLKKEEAQDSSISSPMVDAEKLLDSMNNVLDLYEIFGFRRPSNFDI